MQHPSHAVACPTCGSKAGAFCVYTTGQERPPHEARRTAFAIRQAARASA